jgi:predicted CoA-binding protein
MDLQLEKLELIRLLVETDDKAVIDAVKNIFNSQKKEVWMQLSAEEQETIELRIHEANRGDQVEL